MRSEDGTNLVTSFVRSLSLGSAEIVASASSFASAATSVGRRTTGAADMTDSPAVVRPYADPGTRAVGVRNVIQEIAMEDVLKQSNGWVG